MDANGYQRAQREFTKLNNFKIRCPIFTGNKLWEKCKRVLYCTVLYFDWFKGVLWIPPEYAPLITSQLHPPFVRQIEPPSPKSNTLSPRTSTPHMSTLNGSTWSLVHQPPAPHPEGLAIYQHDLHKLVCNRSWTTSQHFDAGLELFTSLQWPRLTPDRHIGRARHSRSGQMQWIAGCGHHSNFSIVDNYVFVIGVRQDNIPVGGVWGGGSYTRGDTWLL